MNRITIRRPDDFHVHLRLGEMLSKVVLYTANIFARAIVMPNTGPPILTVEDARRYLMDIHTALRVLHFSRQFTPLMTIQITDDTTSKIIREAARSGIVLAGKIYTKGVTSNSHNGVTDFEPLYPVFETMEAEDMVLSIHGQWPSSFILDRERDFLNNVFGKLVSQFPNLRIVLEHISTKEAVDVVRDMPPTVAATITAHHLLLTLHNVLCHPSDDGLREGLCPHHYCQPIPQRPEDRAAIQGAATSGNPKFFFGSDTAPWERNQKEAACGCAGVFSAPVAMQVLTEFFMSFAFSPPVIDQHRADLLEAFASEFGARFYKLPLDCDKVNLVRQPWKVPDSYNGIVPFRAGQTLEWQFEH